MTVTLTHHGYVGRVKRPRLNERGAKYHGVVLGYVPTTAAGWQRHAPKAPGVYPVVAREGGMWLGETRKPGDDWRGWWGTMTTGEVARLKRPLPPAGEWDQQ